MPRPACLPSIPFGWYYYIRIPANGREILRDRADLELFRVLLNATLRQIGAELHFVHVDRNEAHLVMHAGERSLTMALGTFFREYARRINHRRNEGGALCRPHAHVLVFQHQKWLLPLGRYIHWIPRLREARVCWNSDAAYRNRLRTAGLNTSVVLRAVSHGARNVRTQDAAYCVFFDQSPTPTEMHLIERGSPEDSRILGDPEFVTDILVRVGLPAQARAARNPDCEQDIRRAAVAVIRQFHILCLRALPRGHAHAWIRLTTLENVCSKSRKQPLPVLRGLIADHIVSHRIATLEKTERFFGQRSRSLSAGIRRRYKMRAQRVFNWPYEASFELGSDENQKGLSGSTIGEGYETVSTHS